MGESVKEMSNILSKFEHLGLFSPLSVGMLCCVKIVINERWLVFALYRCCWETRRRRIEPTENDKQQQQKQSDLRQHLD